MIIVRSPLRITLGGGGTDLPSYYREHGGYVLSAAIDKYIYVGLMKAFTPGIYLKYSQLEHVLSPDEIKHPIFRELFRLMLRDENLEVTTLADIPAGSGLGSSSSFTAALIGACAAYQGRGLNKEEIAQLACKIEIDILKDPIGKQDQYASAYGGINVMSFYKDDTVEVRPLRISRETQWELEDNLLLFFTGFTRSATTVLRDQDELTKKGEAAMVGALHHTKALGFQSKLALEEGKLKEFGKIMHEHWLHKRQRSKGMTTDRIDELYLLARNNGATGGKLVGAGGGGFLMFYADDRSKLRRAMASAGLEEVRFRFDFEGTKLVLS